MTFDDLRLAKPLLQAVQEEGYTEPTPIQAQAIPPILEGKDLLGAAQTGTGKTAAFALPILHRLLNERIDGEDGFRPIRALILSPTRELAAQIDESFTAYGRHTGLRNTVVFGGVRKSGQIRHLRDGVDILTATPGRLMDLMRGRHANLKHVEMFVLDEADRMLDMGFIEDIRWIVDRLPRKRQSLLLSATIPAAIRHLAGGMLKDPVTIRIAPEAPAAETVNQSVYYVEQTNKRALLTHLLQNNEKIDRALVFLGTKRMADRVTRHLRDENIDADVIHSDRNQKEREGALRRFKAGETRVLVASDIAARGLDVDDISHVFNYDIPPEPEVYVHRIGRTGRAGAAGMAVSFCGVDERPYLDRIEKLINMSIDAVEDHPYPSPLPHKREPVDVKKARGIRSRHRRPGRRRKLL